MQQARTKFWEAIENLTLTLKGELGSNKLP